MFSAIVNQIIQNSLRKRLRKDIKIEKMKKVKIFE